jgi:TP901 family phage tail tape measure protein
MASIDAFKVRAVIEAGYDKASLRKANSEIAQSFNGMKTKLAKVNAIAASAQTNFMMVGATIAASFAAGVGAAASFEEQFVRVKKTLDIAGDSKQVEKSLDSISKKLRDLTKLSPATTDTVTEIAAIGGQLGVAAKDIVSFTDTIQKLTIATNLSAENAAMAMSRLQEITGTATSELDNLGSSLVALGNNFAAQESEIVTAALQIATSTAQIQGEMNNAAVDALAFSTALKAIGQPSQAGATAIVRLMSEMSEAIAQGGDNLEMFAKVARMSVPAFEQLFKLDSSQAVAAFIKGLEDTSSVGLTNISVLQKMGLGQVRTQKAILALAKANDTLYDALNTANEAYLENNALTEEAERRYETLFSELQRGKNLVKAEFIDFGLDNLDGAKNIVKDLNNFLFATTKAATTLFAKFSGGLGVLGVAYSILRGVKISLTSSATEGGILAASLERAQGAAALLKSSLGEVASLTAVSAEGASVAAYATKTRMFKGDIGLPFNTLGPSGLMERLMPGKYQMRLMETLANPAVTSLIYGGNIPKELYGLSNYAAKVQEIQNQLVSPGLRNNATADAFGIGAYAKATAEQLALQELSVSNDPFMTLGEEKMRGGFRRFAPTKMGKLKLQLLKGQSAAILKLRKVQSKLSIDEKSFAERINVTNQQFLRRKTLLNDLNAFMGAARGKGKGFNQVLDKQIEALYGDQLDFGNMGRLDRARLRKSALQGQSKAFNDVVASLQEKVKNTGEATASELQFLEAVDKGRAGLGRFTNAVMGTVKALGKMLIYTVAIQGIFKLVGKFGAAARGVEEYSAALSEASEKLNELYMNQLKLDQLQSGGVLDEITDKAVLENALKKIEQLEAANQKARRELAAELGQSFVENIIIARAGRESKNQGGYLESLIKQEAIAFKKSEADIRQDIGTAVGNVILNAVDPENLKRTGGKLPTIQELMDSLLFSDTTIDASGYKDIYIPSDLFSGVSSGMLIALQESSDKRIGSKEIFAMTGLDNLNDPNVLGELSNDLMNWGKKLGLGDEGILKYIMGDLKQFDFTPGQSAMEQLKNMFNTFRDIFGEEYTDQDVAQFVFDIAKAISTAEGIVGTSLENIEANFKNTLGPGSGLGREIKKFLVARLEDFRDTGIVTEEEIKRAGNNYQRIVELYTKTYDKFTKDNKLASDELKKELGITENAAIQLAARLDKAFTDARKSLVNLTAPLPDDAFQDMTALDVLLNTIKKSAAQAKFEKTLTALGAFGKPVLAAELAKVGVGGLDMAQTYLSNPALASAQEMYLRGLGGSDYVSEIVPEEAEDAEKERLEEMGYFMGEASVMGIVKGIEENSEEITDMFVEVLDNAFNNVFTLYGIFSPSRFTAKHIGEPLIDGVIVGIENGKLKLKDTFAAVINDSVADFELPDMKGSYKGTNVSYEELAGKISGNSQYLTNDFLTQGFLSSLGTTMMQNLDMFAEKLAKSYQQANSRMQEAFAIITQVTRAERAQTDQARALVKAKQDYAAVLRREASLSERLEKQKEKLMKLEVTGMAGNITVQERIGLLQRELDLTERKRRLDKDYTAREQLDIQAKEKEVAELGRMFNLGIVSALEVDAARDELREMKGEFKSETEKELFLLEYSNALEQKAEYEKEILEISPELVAARDAYIQLLDEQKLISLDVQAGANGIAEAEERVAEGVLSVDAAYANFKENAPEYVDEIGALEGAFGSVNTRVETLFGLINNLTKEGTFDFSSLKTQISDVTQDLADLLFAREMDELLDAGGVSGFRNVYQTAMQAALTGSGMEGRGFSQLMRMGLTNLDAYPILMEAYNALGGSDGNEVSDLSNIDKYSKFFKDSQFQKARVNRQGNILNNASYGQAMIDFLNMMGIGTVETDTGELGFSITNAEDISKGLSKELMVLGLRGMQEYEYMKILNSQMEALANRRSGPIVEEFFNDDDKDGTGPGTPGRNTVVNINSSNIPGGNLPSYLNELLFGTGSAFAPLGQDTGGYKFGGRIKGFKMGGRVPDMTHITPKKYAMGGRDNLMRRALVGEYGPEEVRFVPGSGFLVKPLTQGGRGNNTIVEHLSVNVTGVPADPSQARKAAIQISKALSRLDREGSVGGNIRRT